MLPKFSRVQLVNDDITYENIYSSERQSKTAWLISENRSLWNFIETLGESDNKSDFQEPLNLYSFYAAYNIQFPTNSAKVMLINKSRVLQSDLNDFAALLNSILNASGNACAVLIQCKSPDDDLKQLKVKILQQFIYLRIYLPVISAQSVEEAINNQEKKQPLRDIGILGTKNSGKSTLINALIGGEYAISSYKLSTPNKIIYSAGNSDKISLKYKDTETDFADVESLQTYLLNQFEIADNQVAALAPMNIYIPNFPKYLNNFRLVDTPGSNFAVNSEHFSIAKKALSDVNCVIFVMNYSTHLTDDEIHLFDEIYKKHSEQIILIAINHADEIYSSEEVKSYERIEDYIYNRLNSLGYDNFLVLSMSALQAVYINKIDQLLNPQCDSILTRFANYIKKLFNKTPPFDEQLQALKIKYRKTDNLTAISLVNNIMSDFEDFHNVKIATFDELKEVSRVEYLKNLLSLIGIL